MASPVPQTPRPPGGHERRRLFWHGVLVAVGVLGGLYFAFTVYINWKFDGREGGSYTSYSRNRVTNGLSTICALKEQVTVTVDGRTGTVTPEEPGIWKFTDREVAWSCGYRKRSFDCYEGTEYLIVVRHPNSDALSLRCEIFELPGWADTLPPDDRRR